jgi:hypothetical protein
MLVDFESALGTVKGTPAPRKITYVSESVSGTQNLIRNQSIRADGNRPAPVNGNITAGGQIQVVADIDSVGWWLKLLNHSVSSSGASDPYTHTYKWDISAVTFRSAFLDLQLGTSRYKTLNGMRIKKFGVKFMSEGFLLLTIDVVGLNCATTTSATLTGTPTDWTASTPLHMLQIAAADLLIDGVAKTTAGGNADCLAELEIDPSINITENDYRIGASGARSGLAVGAMDLGVKLKMAVEGTTQFTFMQSTTSHDVTLKFTAAANRTLQLNVPAFYVQKTLPMVQNDMGMFVDIEGMAAYDATAATQLKWVLVNGNDSATLYV